jgi:hypothetical protein
LPRGGANTRHAAAAGAGTGASFFAVATADETTEVTAGAAGLAGGEALAGAGDGSGAADGGATAGEGDFADCFASSQPDEASDNAVTTAKHENE